MSTSPDPIPPGEVDPDERFRTHHLQADIGRRAVRGGALAIGTQAAKFVLNLLSTVILARLIAPADHGLVFMAVSVTGIIGLVKEFGLPTAAIQKAEVNHKLASTLFWLNVVAGVGTALLTAAVAPLIAWFYGEDRLVVIAIITGVSYFIDACGVQHDALLRRQMRFGPYAVTEIVSTVVGLIGAILFALAGFGYWVLLLRQLIMSLVKTLGVWLYTRWLPGPPVRRTGARALLRAGGEMTGETLVLYLSRNIDNVLIGWRWGSAELGVYGRVYYLLLMPMRQIIWPLESVAMPLLSRLLDQPERYRSSYLRILEKIAMLTMPGAAIGVAVPDWVILTVLGPKWIEASPILALLCVAALTEPLLSSTNWLFITQARTRELLHSGLVNAGITIIAIIIGLSWHATGVAAGLAISGVLLRTPILIGWVCRRGPISVGAFYKSLIPGSAGALGVLVALDLFRRAAPSISPVLGLLSACVLAGIVTLLVFIAIPSGRSALGDGMKLFRLLQKKSDDESALRSPRRGVVSAIKRPFKRSPALRLLYRTLFRSGVGQILVRRPISAFFGLFGFSVLKREDLRRQASVFHLVEYGADETASVAAPIAGGPISQRAASALIPYTLHIPRPFTVEIPDVRLIGESAIGFISDGSLIAETMVPYFSKKDITDNTSSLSLIRSRFRSHEIESLPRVFSLVNAWNNNYCMWLSECLSRLEGLEDYERRTGHLVPILIRPDSPRYQIDSLRLMGYPPERCHLWNGSKLAVDTLIASSFRREPRGDYYYRVSLAGLRWVRERIRTNLPPPNPDAPIPSRRVFISRRSALARRIVNEAEVMRHLAPLGFVPYVLEEMPFADQVRLFAQASFVVSPHGAGLMNLGFAEKPIVIELFGRHIQPSFSELARGYGLPYAFMECRAPARDLRFWDADLIVDIPILAGLIEKMLRENPATA